MTDDIVEDLRGALRRDSGERFWQNYFRRAADEIERLRTANRNLLHTIERLGDQMLEREARRG